MWNSATPKLDKLTQNRICSNIDELCKQINFKNNCKERPNSLKEALKSAQTRGEDPGRQQTIALKPETNSSDWMDYSAMITLLYKRDNPGIDSILEQLRNGHQK